MTQSQFAVISIYKTPIAISNGVQIEISGSQIWSIWCGNLTEDEPDLSLTLLPSPGFNHSGQTSHDPFSNRPLTEYLDPFFFRVIHENQEISIIYTAQF